MVPDDVWVQGAERPADGGGDGVARPRWPHRVIAVGLLTVSVACQAAQPSSRAKVSPEGVPSPVQSSQPATSGASPSATPSLIDRTISIGPGPVFVVGAFGSIWVSNHHGASVSRIDPSTGKVIATIPVGDQPANITVGMSRLWETNYDGTISVIDPKDDKVGTVGHFPHLCGAPTVDAGAVWVFVCDVDHPFVARVDVETGKTTARIPSEAYQTSLLAVDGVLWMTTSSPGRIERVDARTGKILQSFRAPGCPMLSRTAAGDGSIWISQWSGCPTGDIGKVLRMDPRTGRIQGVVTMPSSAPIVSVGAGGVWAASADDGSIRRVDPQSSTAIGWTSLPATSLYGFEAAYGSLWAVDFNDQELWQVAAA